MPRESLLLNCLPEREAYAETRHTLRSRTQLHGLVLRIARRYGLVDNAPRPRARNNGPYARRHPYAAVALERDRRRIGDLPCLACYGCHLGFGRASSDTRRCPVRRIVVFLLVVRRRPREGKCPIPIIARPLSRFDNRRHLDLGRLRQHGPGECHFDKQTTCYGYAYHPCLLTTHLMPVLRASWAHGASLPLQLCTVRPRIWHTSVSSPNAVV